MSAALSASREHVTIPDPDSPFGSPAFDGPARDASTRLEPGVYPATDEDGDPLHLIVGHGTVIVARGGQEWTRAGIDVLTWESPLYGPANACRRCGILLTDDDRGPLYDAVTDDGTPHVCS